MEIIRVREKIFQKFNAPSVALGNFDGVHLGHQEILKQTVESAHRKGRDALVYTFDPHPRVVLQKAPDLPQITTPAERAEIFEWLGIDVLILAEFTLEFATQTPEEFVANVLVEELEARNIFIGENYRFGKDRGGTIQTLRKLAPAFGFSVCVVPPVLTAEAVVSSSRIRECLMQGEIRKANLMLGREFTIEGQVIHGHGRGKALGYPTANIKPEPKLQPPPGVYAVYCRVCGEIFRGVMNIGDNPTFKDRRVAYEVYILDFDKEIYGETIKVYFVERLRPEEEFSTAEDLRVQIARDVERGREILTGGPLMP